MKYVRIEDVVEAEQFNYVGEDIESQGTITLAESLGLSRNLYASKLWELSTPQGWRIVYSGDFIITKANGQKEVVGSGTFYHDFITHQPY